MEQNDQPQTSKSQRRRERREALRQVRRTLRIAQAVQILGILAEAVPAFAKIMITAGFEVTIHASDDGEGNVSVWYDSAELDQAKAVLSYLRDTDKAALVLMAICQIEQMAELINAGADTSLIVGNAYTLTGLDLLRVRLAISGRANMN